MNKIVTIVVFLLLTILASVLCRFATGYYFPPANVQNIWFYSGIIMILFSSLIIEPYYVAPKNVLANSVAALLVLISIRQNLINEPSLVIIWWGSLIFLLLLLFISVLSMILSKENTSSDDLSNKISEYLKNFSSQFGSSKIIFSIIFLTFLLYYHSIQSVEILYIIIFWGIIVIVDIPHLISRFNFTDIQIHSSLGEIFGVQSKNTFLAKLYQDKTNEVNDFDPIQFNYPLHKKSKMTTGIVVESYFLNEEKWVNILKIGEREKMGDKFKENIIYPLPDNGENERISKLVGIVIDQSNIERIKFKYAHFSESLEEGDLVTIEISGKKIFYQVMNGVTNKEKLQEKNETGFITVDAIQLGRWDEENYRFEKFGWVPEINSLVIKSEKTFKIPEINYPEYIIGNIPNTNLPAIINLDTAISHHLAILGITGSGKSFITLEIIRQLISNTKVICIDFTGEYIDDLAEFNPSPIIPSDSDLEELEHLIAEKEDQDKARGGSKTKSLELKNKISNKLTGYLREFLEIATEDKSEYSNNLALFELPDMSNTSFILEFTQMFLDGVFKYAKSNAGQRICIVVEEAHTVVPETNSLGDFGDYSSNKALVNKIGQIALQGRKYGVGFIVIAQRTANVSKTVLTQCNSVVCFQAFDKTSYDFLGNYLGDDLISVLPNLKQYHAVIAGKALKSNIPMIVNLTRDIENRNGG